MDRRVPLTAAHACDRDRVDLGEVQGPCHSPGHEGAVGSAVEESRKEERFAAERRRDQHGNDRRRRLVVPVVGEVSGQGFTRRGDLTRARASAESTRGIHTGRGPNRANTRPARASKLRS